MTATRRSRNAGPEGGDRSLHVDHVTLGVCYYPEQWAESLWQDDFRRMRDLGFEIVRMGEFAWSIFEPEEGRFSFDLFDRAIADAARHGLKVILGTPTATPPAWLTTAYPEALNVTREGVQLQHGLRRHCGYNAPSFHRLATRVVRELAIHYADHPAVIGWQIDNELNCEVDLFYAEADQTAFRDWLRCRYSADLEALNRSWGTLAWSQTYSSWDEIRLPGPTPHDSHNPHQLLDEKRFISDSAISFVRIQTEILRALAPRQWITTNGMYKHLDNHRLTDELLDFFSFDSYPNFSTIRPPIIDVNHTDSTTTAGGGSVDPLRDRASSWLLSIVRGISPTFAVLEQQSGAGGWVDRIAQPAPKPGQMRLWTYQSIAHGGDMVLYFRWRTATVGTEIYWHGINDQHNQPNRRVEEVARISQELAAAAPRIAGTTVAADVAILADYDNEWDGEVDVWHGPLTKQSVRAWFTALQFAHVPVDAFYLRPGTTPSDLAGYRLLVYPHAAILSADTATLLDGYVRDGGTVIFGARTGYKDPTGKVSDRPLPGPVADLCGVTVTDSTMILSSEPGPVLRWRGIDAAPSHAPGFNEIVRLDSDTAEVLAEYGDDYYAGTPALVRNRRGLGSALFFGAAFTLKTAATILAILGVGSPVEGWLELPSEVELAIRERPDTRDGLAFVMNFSSSARTIEVRRESLDILSGRSLKGFVTLAPFDVLLLDGSTEMGEASRSHQSSSDGRCS